MQPLPSDILPRFAKILDAKKSAPLKKWHILANDKPIDFA
jgi:hypothetical protein